MFGFGSWSDPISVSFVVDPDKTGILLRRNPGSSFSFSRYLFLFSSVVMSLDPGFFALTSSGTAGVVKTELGSVFASSLSSSHPPVSES